MASTTIPNGLEIRRLCWKDDSFRQADHEPTPKYGMLGWWDNTISGGNAITFSNTGSSLVTSSNPVYGGVVTPGVFGLESPAFTNGDELYLPGGTEVEKDFPVAVPANIIASLRLRAKNIGSTTTLTVTLLTVVSGAWVLLPPYNFTLASSLYTHYTLPIVPVSNVYGIRMSCDNGAIIDYVALGSSDYINQGGQSLDVTIPKKTKSQTVPMSIDIIQQLGISSRSKAVMIPKIPTTAYRWLEAKLDSVIPLELVTPTQQATGYLSDQKRHSEAGWVGNPIPTTDSLAVTAQGQQLYDVSFSLIKSDNEVNIDLTCPVVPVSPPTLILPISNGICATDGSKSNDSYQRHGWYMAGLWWVFYTNDCALEPGSDIGFWYRTSSDRIHWSAATQIVTTARPTEQFNTGIWFDGTYLYYVASDGSSVSSESNSLWFRRGIPHSDSTITWSAAEQEITGMYANTAFSAVVWVFTDANGYSWAMNGRADGSHATLMQNANTDGTWSTSTVHRVDAQRMGAVPLSNGNVVQFWTSMSAPFIHKFSTWDGFTWSAVVSDTSGNHDYDGIAFSAVSTANNQVHSVFINTSNQLVYQIYDSLSNTITYTSVIAGAAPTTNATIATDSNGADTNVFYGQGNYIKFFKRRLSDGAYSVTASENFGSTVGGRGVESWDDSGGYVYFWFTSGSNFRLAFWQP